MKHAGREAWWLVWLDGGPSHHQLLARRSLAGMSLVVAVLGVVMQCMMHME